MTYTPTIHSMVDNNNSTSYELKANETFNGKSTNVINYNSINISAISNQNSAIDGLIIQFSSDNINWNNYKTFTLIAGKYFCKSIFLLSQYYRICYKNGNIDQKEFRLSVLLTFSTNNLIEMDNVSLGITVDNPTYRCCILGIDVVKDLTFSIRGSNCNTIKITKIGYTLLSYKSSYINLSIHKYNNISGGKSEIVNTVSLDSNNNANKAIVEKWSLTPNIQNSTGIIHNNGIFLNSKSYIFKSKPINIEQDIIEFGNRIGTSSVILNSNSEWLGIALSDFDDDNLTANFWIEWTEITQH